MSIEQITVSGLYDLEQTIAADIFRNQAYPWKVLPLIKEFIMALGSQLSFEEYDLIAENVWVAKNAKIAPTAYIQGPAIIDKGAEIRHCAYIRGSVIVGENCVVGNSTELKNVILFNNVQVPHYNYVGDSILGYRAHMGAGSITSNVKSDKTMVSIHCDGKDTQTGLKKVGAFLGDYVEVGCNSVLNPGTVIGRNSNIYPLSSVRGCVPQNSIYKKAGEVCKKR